MPIGRSPKKSLRKSVKNRKYNVAFKKQYKLLVKEFLNKPTKENFAALTSKIDKSLKKNIFHKNKVARLKSKFSKKLKMMEKTKPSTGAVKKKTAKKS